MTDNQLIDFIRDVMGNRGELLLESYSDDPFLLVEAARPVHAEQTRSGKMFIEGLALSNQINRNGRRYDCLDESVQKAQQKLKDGHLLGSLTHTDFAQRGHLTHAVLPTWNSSAARIGSEWPGPAPVCPSNHNAEAGHTCR
jgi:hypothetical protein